jgi:predicted GTPase
MGYGDEQVKDLEATINAVPCEAVIIGTPIDLRRILKINKPSVRVQYALEEITTPDLGTILGDFLTKMPKKKSPKKKGRRRK